MSLTGRVLPSEKLLMQDHIVSIMILFPFEIIYLSMYKFDHLLELWGLMIFDKFLVGLVPALPLS
jgi:hypothetical protein